MAVYGFAKQPTVYSLMTKTSNQQILTTTTTENTRRVVLPNGTTLAVQVAETEAQRNQGLAGVEQINSGSGMLFVFDQSGNHSMWMKGMQIPLDIVWLDEQGKVVYLATQVQPPKDDQAELSTYVNDEPARYVLELAAGEAEMAGIKEGVHLTLS